MRVVTSLRLVPYEGILDLESRVICPSEARVESYRHSGINAFFRDVQVLFLKGSTILIIKIMTL